MPYFKVIKETTSRFAQIIEADTLDKAKQRMRFGSNTGRIVDLVEDDSEEEWFGYEVKGPAKRGERWREVKETKVK